MDGNPDSKERAVPADSELDERQYVGNGQSGTEFLDQFTLDDTNSFLTSDVGGPIQDNAALKAGERGPTLLEDFIFRQKIQHFDHERVCHNSTEFESRAYCIRCLNEPFMPVGQVWFPSRA
jgi:hypothetical protein